MITFRAGKIVTAVLLSLFAAGCSREQQDWRSAEAADTIEGYDQFLTRHPDSELATQARTRVAQLTEDRDWQRAGAADSADAYRQFLAQHPNGKWAQEARIRVENFSLGGPPSQEPRSAAANAASSPSAQTGLSSSAPLAAAARAPSWETQEAPAARGATVPLEATAAQARTAAQEPAATAGLGAYGVQLGAFSSQSGATNEWRQLSARFEAQLRGLSPRISSANTPAGRLYRLQAAVPDEAHARAVCEELKKQSQPCVPVLPH